MTTIAYRDGIIAADTAMYSGDCLSGATIKISRYGLTLAGAAGLASYNRKFLDWVVGGFKGEPPEARTTDNSYDRGVLFLPGNEIVVHEPEGVFKVTAEYYAIGSGKAEALGAMFAGADAETAVRAAIAIDPYTGGEITVLKR